jgi:hypothetical protein
MIDVGQHIFCGPWLPVALAMASASVRITWQHRRVNLRASGEAKLLIVLERLSDNTQSRRFFVPSTRARETLEGTARTCALHAELCRMTVSSKLKINFLFLFLLTHLTDVHITEPFQTSHRH